MKMSKKTRSLGRNKRHLRVRKRLAGTQDRPRVSLFRSNRNIYLQLIDDNEGKTLASVSSLKSDNNSMNKDLSKKLGVEFGEKIPPYLRKPMQSLDTKSPDYQSRYIKDVVNIIEEYGD